MGAKKYPRRLRAYAKVAAGGTGYVRTDTLKLGEVLACQSIAFRNRTKEAGTIEAYIKEGEARTFIFDQISPSKNVWYWYPYTQFIKAGEQIEVQQAECGADDELDLHVIGYIMFNPEGLVE